MYSNPYIALVPKINSGKEKCKEKIDGLSKDTAPP